MIKRTVLLLLALSLGLTLLTGAAWAANVPLVVVDSVVHGHKNAAPEQVCIKTSRFFPGEHIVWRIKVIDPTTGETMDDSTVNQVWVEFPDGQTLEANFGPHGGKNPVDSFWTTSWEIPEDYPSGVLDYTVHAEAADGRSGEGIKFPIPSSLLTILPPQ